MLLLFLLLLAGGVVIIAGRLLVYGFFFLMPAAMMGGVMAYAASYILGVDPMQAGLVGMGLAVLLWHFLPRLRRVVDDQYYYRHPATYWSFRGAEGLFVAGGYVIFGVWLGHDLVERHSLTGIPYYVLFVGLPLGLAVLGWLAHERRYQKLLWQER